MEKLGNIAYKFEKKHPVLAEVIGIISIILLIVLGIVAYIYKTR